MNNHEAPGSPGQPDQPSSPQFPSPSNESAALTKFAALLQAAHELIDAADTTKAVAAYEGAISYAHEWLLNEQRSKALQELANYHLKRNEWAKALKVSIRLSNFQERTFGSEYPELAKTYFL